jgi:hypothetical protein
MRYTVKPAAVPLTLLAGALWALTGLGFPALRAQPQKANNYLPQRGESAPVGEPVALAIKDGGRKGWKVVIPGNRPLATPAVAGGQVFRRGGRLSRGRPGG